ncbi:hypothetical protein D3C81_199110 [compost metagenome]
MNICDYVLDYLNAFVVSEELTDGVVVLNNVETYKYVLYVNHVYSLKLYVFGKFCVIYLHCSEDEENIFAKKIEGICHVRKRYNTIVRDNAFVTDITFEFSLYKEKKASQVLEVILNFIKERAQSD